MTKRRTFPCPSCHGTGGDIETLDVGIGIEYHPLYDCGYCEGAGLIEVNGPIHNKLRLWKLGATACAFLSPGMEIEGLLPKCEELAQWIRDNQKRYKEAYD
jgi:hypothetical protein